MGKAKETLNMNFYEEVYKWVKSECLQILRENSVALAKRNFHWVLLREAKQEDQNYELL